MNNKKTHCVSGLTAKKKKEREKVEDLFLSSNMFFKVFTEEF